MNYAAFHYVSNVILNNFNKQELYLLYKYLLNAATESMTIFDCLKKAKQYIEEEKRLAEKEKLKSLEVGKQADYGDLCL